MNEKRETGNERKKLRNKIKHEKRGGGKSKPLEEYTPVFLLYMTDLVFLLNMFDLIFLFVLDKTLNCLNVFFFFYKDGVYKDTRLRFGQNLRTN